MSGRTSCVCALAAAGLMLAPAAAQPPLSADAGRAAAAIEGCQTDLRLLNQVGGWQVTWPRDWTQVPRADAARRRAALQHWSAAPAALQAAQIALSEGLEEGRAAPKPVVERVLQQVSSLLRELRAGNGDAFAKSGDNAFDTAWRTLFETQITPAISKYEQYLGAVYLKRAADSPALPRAADGESCFAQTVTWWTTTKLSPPEIAVIGERYLADSAAALLATAPEGTRLQSLLAELRTPTPGATAEDLIAVSEAAIERAQAALDETFSGAPVVPVVVTGMEAHLQDSAPAGYYLVGNPSAYVINLSRPAERRLMAEVIAFHETVPGHHLSAIYPAGGERAFNSGFLEGWAIYAEYLADEMGLYSTVRDRQGMIAKHLWAASRLVVEPGLQTGGWTRQRAIDFMRERTALPLAEIEIEVDRYIAMPGQSLTYMLGADAILGARERAKAALGERFDIKKFHDVVLGPGSRPLPELAADIDAWIAKPSD